MTTTMDLSGLAARLKAGLAEARRKGNAMWFVGGAAQKFAVGVIDRGHYHIYAEWYRPESHSDDDASRATLKLPHLSGQARVTHEIDVPDLDDPRVSELLARIPATHARTLVAWYPPVPSDV